MPKFCILDEKKELVPVDIITWAQWFETSDRSLGYDNIGPYRVSTVFLGIDRSFNNSGLHFETMVFPDKSSSDLYSKLYHTYKDAIKGHKKTVEMVKNGEIK